MPFFLMSLDIICTICERCICKKVIKHYTELNIERQTMKHSRRQIQEAISYWQKQLKKIDESSSFRNRNNIDTVSELY